MRTAFYLSKTALLSLLLTSSLDAYDYKKHIPEEYQKYVPGGDSDVDIKEGSLNEEYYGPVHFTDKKTKKLKINGPASLSYVEVKENLIVNGPASLDHAQVKERLVVHGTLDASTCTIHALEVMGPVNLTNSVVMKKAKIFGPLDAIDSQFKHDLEITSDTLSLENTEAHSIHILKNGNDVNKQQKLILKKGTVIHSNITFESGHGIVVVSKGVKIKGKVRGAKIEHFG